MVLLYFKFFKSLLFKLIIFCFLGSPIILSAQVKVDYQKLNYNLNKAVEDYKVPGLAIGIIADGKVVFQKGYGQRILEDKIEMKTTTLFKVASLSKAITAAGIGTLVDAGKLNWSDKIVDYLPYFELNDKSVSDQLTIEDLLCHHSGLETFDGDLLWFNSTYTTKEVVERIKNRELSYDLRTKFGYQNVMYMVLGLIIEEVSGMSWEDYIQSNILKPLRMFNTFCKSSKVQENSNIAYPYVNDKRLAEISYDNAKAALGIYSNVTDLNKWISMWINKGKYEDRQILKEETVTKMFTMHSVIPINSFEEANGTHFNGYGFGWFITDYQGRKIVHHGGGLPGYTSKIVLVPEEDMGFIILSNDNNYLTKALMYKLLDDHFGIAKKDWQGDFLEAKENEILKLQELLAEHEAIRNKKSTPKNSLSSYVGTYTDKMYGSAIISGSRKLKMDLIPSQGYFTAELEHWYDDTFRFVLKDELAPPGLVEFKYNGEGEVEGFRIELDYPHFHFDKLDFKKN